MKKGKEVLKGIKITAWALIILLSLLEFIDPKASSIFVLSGYVISLVIANKCSKWAKEINKSMNWAYIIGFVLGLFGLLYYFIYYKIKKTNSKKNKTALKTLLIILLIMTLPMYVLSLSFIFLNNLFTSYDAPNFIEERCNNYCVKIDSVTKYFLEYNHYEERFYCYCINNEEIVLDDISYKYPIENFN